LAFPEIKNTLHNHHADEIQHSGMVLLNGWNVWYRDQSTCGAQAWQHLNIMSKLAIFMAKKQWICIYY